MVKTKTKQKRTKGSKQVATSKLKLVDNPGMPDTFHIVLRASSSWNLNHAGTLNTMGFGCNTPFSPYYTYTLAEAPSYLTWLTNTYDTCYTKRSRIHVELVNSNVNDSLTVALGYESDLTGTPTINEIAESHGAKSSVVGHYSGGANRTKLMSHFTPMELMRVPYNSPLNLCASGSPPNPYYWILGVKSIAGGSGNIGIKVIVEYDLEFAQLAKPAPN